MPPRSTLILATFVAALALAAPAQAARSCDAPGRSWERATPEEAGMDSRKVQAALDSATGQISYAVRVYRHGCLVGEDRLAPLNRDAQYESFSMAKSVTSLVFGRAMTLGLISPDDPVGALLPEADAAHGAITMRDLLTMSSGLHWNGLRDYNLFTMPDRVRDALTTDLEHAPGTYYEYAQSPVTLLGEAIGRAVGEDMMDFAQRELMDPLGIREGTWRWTRDRAGHIGAFYGVGMRPDDFGRLGELLRRGGVWNGRRLLSRRYVREAIEPAPTNGCYGWLIWVNAGAPCIGPRITRRPVVDSRALPNMPADMYRFVGAFGQLVAVFPSQDLVVVRTGTYNQNALISPDGAATTTSASGQEQGLYQPFLDAITDERVERPPGEPQEVHPDLSNPDAGFHTSALEPEEYTRGIVQDPLPEAGPARARAPQPQLTRRRVSQRGTIAIRLTCPARWPTPEPRRCVGEATLARAQAPVRYDVAPGETAVLRFRLARRAVLRGRETSLELTATNRDAAGGTRTHGRVTALPPSGGRRRSG